MGRRADLGVKLRELLLAHLQFAHACLPALLLHNATNTRV